MPDEGAPLTSAQPVAQCLTLFLRPFTRAFYNSSFCDLIISHFLMRCLITVRADRECGAEEQAEVRSESVENNPETKENTKVESSET